MRAGTASIEEVRVGLRGEAADEAQSDLDALRGVWLSRLMFNMFVGWPPETRSFEEFVEVDRV